jgi:hypothetical protein
MSEKKKRYNFDGFTFGQNGFFELKVEVLDESGFGHTLGFGLELSPEEREELIKLLINLGKKDN